MTHEPDAMLEPRDPAGELERDGVRDSPRPADRRPEPSSVPVLRRVLRWSAVVAAGVAIVGGGIGLALVGMPGLWSALVGAAIAFGFAGLTALALILAARLDPVWFFGAILGSWLVKFVAFLAVLWLVKGQPWTHPVVLWACLMAGILGSVAVDVWCVVRSRVPYVSDPEARNRA